MKYVIKKMDIVKIVKMVFGMINVNINVLIIVKIINVIEQMENVLIVLIHII
jgi:hypothetical protein